MQKENHCKWVHIMSKKKMICFFPNCSHAPGPPPPMSPHVSNSSGDNLNEPVRGPCRNDWGQLMKNYIDARAPRASY